MLLIVIDSTGHIPDQQLTYYCGPRELDLSCKYSADTIAEINDRLLAAELSFEKED